MIKFLFNLFTRAQDDSKVVYKDIPIGSGWTLFLTENDTDPISFSANTIQKELETLRSHNTKSIISKIADEVKKVFNSMDDDIRKIIQKTSIPSDTRLKLFKDVFHDLSPKWLSELVTITSTYNTDTKSLIEGNWYSSDYERNILGQIVSITDRWCSTKMEEKSLSLAIRGTHRSIVHSLESLNIHITSDMSGKILNLIIKTSISRIIDKWSSTAVQSVKTLTRYGKLPEKWRLEEKKKKALIEEIKREGKHDKYVDGTKDPVRIAYMQGSQRTKLVENDTMQKLKTSVSNMLLKRTIRPKKTVEIQGMQKTEFNHIKKNLESLLKF